MNYDALPARLLFFLVSLILLLWPALFNAFPLVTPDTGTYIISGMQHAVQADRSIGYGIFLWLTSMGISLWLVVLAQAIILNWLLRSLCRRLLGNKASRPLLLLILVVVGFGTSASWFAGQLMPDIFTSVLLLSILLFFLVKEKKQRWLYGVLIFLSCIIHNSHVPIVLLFGALLMLYYYRKKQKEALRASSRIFLTSLGAGVLMCFINLWSGFGFGLSPASHVFLMSRMAENGILDKYLKDQCPVKHYALCDEQGKLGLRQWDFMWGPQYPHNKAGWNDKEVRKEYQHIIAGTLTDPRLLGLHMLRSAEGAFRELPLIYVSDGTLPQGEGSSPYNAVAQYFSTELKEYHCTMQNDNVLGATVQYVNIFIVCFALLSGIATLWLSQRDWEAQQEERSFSWREIFGLAALFLLANAFVTSTFSTVVARFQARIFWVLPFLFLLYILDHYLSRSRQKTPV